MTVRVQVSAGEAHTVSITIGEEVTLLEQSAGGTAEYTFPYTITPEDVQNGQATLSTCVTIPDSDFAPVTALLTIPVGPAVQQVPYLDENGVQQTADAAVLTGSEDGLSGWYAVTEDLTLDRSLSLVGDVQLILTDGHTLTLPADGGIEGNAFLTVYGLASGALCAGSIRTAGFAQYSGTSVSLTAPASLQCKGDIMLCGTMSAAGSVSSGGTITLSPGDAGLTAGSYAAPRVCVAPGLTLLTPAHRVLREDTLHLTGPVSLPYNGTAQTPALPGRLVYQPPCFSGTLTSVQLDAIRGQLLCPGTAQETVLTDADLALGGIGSGTDAGSYTCEVAGKGAYEGNVQLSWEITPADVQSQITAEPAAPITAGQALLAQALCFSASSDTAQLLLDAVAEGRAQITVGETAAEPGDYVLQVCIRETDGANFLPVELEVPYTVLPVPVAPDETLCAWAAADYEQRTGTHVTPVPAGKDGTALTVTLENAEGTAADTYVIDTVTGSARTSSGETTELPQTGNLSYTALVWMLAALALIGAGGLAVKRSGVRR